MSFAKSLRAWFRRLASLVDKSKRDAELAEELESHLQMHIEDNLRGGMTLEAARRNALLKLGGVEQTKETYRDRRGMPVLEALIRQRTPEIGIRLALGAQRGELLRLTLVDGLKPAAGGLLLGLAGAMATGKMIRSLLYGVQPLDAGVLVAVAVSLFAVAAIACLLPAWRASRVDPITALRYE